MVEIEPGWFWMGWDEGSRAERPRHLVWTDGFAIKTLARTPAGHGRFRTEWQAEPLGTPFGLQSPEDDQWFGTSLPGPNGGSGLTTIPALGPAPGAAPKAPGTRVEAVPDASFSSRPFAQLQGKLRLPVRGEVTNRFGAPREEPGSTWKGLFIRADGGAPVHAVADGRVVYAEWLRGFGNLLILDHGKGYMSLYAQGEALARKVGEVVRAGDPVAQAGASGGQAETGLYFELRRDGKPFDPMRWVAQ